MCMYVLNSTNTESQGGLLLHRTIRQYQVVLNIMKLHKIALAVFFPIDILHFTLFMK